MVNRGWNGKNFGFKYLTENDVMPAISANTQGDMIFVKNANPAGGTPITLLPGGTSDSFEGANGTKLPFVTLDPQEVQCWVAASDVLDHTWYTFGDENLPD